MEKPIGTSQRWFANKLSMLALRFRLDAAFPGLDTFGHNRQMAWLMWHAAMDRTLPEINKLLEGVPEDLAAVIQKLAEKDPARRYRTAAEALGDLRTDGAAHLPALRRDDPEAEAARIRALQKKRRRRLVAVCAVAMRPAEPAISSDVPKATLRSEAGSR